MMRRMQRGERHPMTSQSSTNYESALTKRLREAIDARGTNARAISKRAGCGPTAVSDILTGRNKKPSAHVLQNIATALSCPVDFFTKYGADSGRPVIVPLIVELNIEVVGVAETGTYRSGERVAIFRKIAGPQHRRFPDAKPQALEIRDKSMDRAEPMPLPFGAFACFIAIAEAGGRIEHGNIYVIERKLTSSQSGNMVETLIRRAVKKNGDVTLHADSSDAQRYPDITVKDLSTDPTRDAYVVGVVYAMVGYIGD